MLNLPIGLKLICMQKFLLIIFTKIFMDFFEIKNHIKNFFCVISSSFFANFSRAFKISWFSGSLIDEIYSKKINKLNLLVFDWNLLLRESKEISNGHTKTNNRYVNDVKPLKNERRILKEFYRKFTIIEQWERAERTSLTVSWMCMLT